MFPKLTKSFWAGVARIILRNRILILSLLLGATIFLALQWKNIRMTYSEANMLPSNHPISLQYQEFLKLFGEEGNLIVIAAPTDTVFSGKNFQQWNDLAQQIEHFPEVEAVLSLHSIKALTKDTQRQTFTLRPFFPKEEISEKQIAQVRKQLLEDSPFYEGILYNSERNALQMVVSMKKDIVNTVTRKNFILKKLQPLVEQYKKPLDLHVSGMPYIRTLSTEVITGEIGLFIGGALLVTCLVFFFFFRSFRAMFISMCSVIIGVMWAFGFLGLFHYEITILTAVIPPLVIVIGIPNCIFLINRYQQEMNRHRYKAMALQRVISKVGNVTLITNLTTASGFATFIITQSAILKEFGIIASLSIISLFVISLCVIPIIYSYMPMPKDRHLKHLNKPWIDRLVSQLEIIVKKHRFATYITAVLLLALSIIGIYRIKISGSLIEDMPQSTDFYQDVLFFEQEFGGIMPLEITVDSHRKNGINKEQTLKGIQELENFLEDIPEISKPISVLNLVKYAKQAYYNSNKEYYDLPTPQERNFILSYVKNSPANTHMLRGIVDSTGQIARITVFMKDIGTEKMQQIEQNIARKVQKIFPPERYTVQLTGKAYMFTKGTDFLVSNLIQSLVLAIGIISLLMAYMFRSFRMVLISLVPNLLPLMITAGMMGFLGVPLKPSTILVFSIAFGISVDDTIHFLAKYRQELIQNNWKIKKSVYAALHETGVSMFYTSVTLFFGFSIFILSNFGGTKALGALVSVTLLFAMLTNLVLLPSLLLSLEKSLSNKQTIKELSIDLLPEED